MLFIALPYVDRFRKLIAQLSWLYVRWDVPKIYRIYKIGV